MEVRYIGIEEIEPDKDNRKFEEQTLITSVEREGIINPILLHPREDGRYDIVDGNRRYLSARHYGLKQVPAFIIERDDYASIQGAENLDRKPLSMIDMSILVKRMISEGMADPEIREMTGLGKAAYRRMVLLANLDSKVVKAVKHGDLDVKRAMEIAILPKDKQREVFDKLGGNYSEWTVANAVRDCLPDVNSFSPALKACVTDCESCPKHARSPQCDLFEDKPYRDLCVDTKCFSRKMEEFTKGVRLVDPENLPEGYVRQSPYGDHIGAEECVDSNGSTVWLEERHAEERKQNEEEVAVKACRRLWGKKLKGGLTDEWADYLAVFHQMAKTCAEACLERNAVSDGLADFLDMWVAQNTALAQMLGLDERSDADNVAIAMTSGALGWWSRKPLELSAPGYPERPERVDKMVSLFGSVLALLEDKSEGKRDELVREARLKGSLFELDYGELLEEQKENGNPNMEVKDEG